MSNNIDLKGGLNIPISGTAVQKTRKTIVPDVIAVKPTDFKGLIPRLLVKEGERFWPDPLFWQTKRTLTSSSRLR